MRNSRFCCGTCGAPLKLEEYGVLVVSTIVAPETGQPTRRSRDWEFSDVLGRSVFCTKNPKHAIDASVAGELLDLSNSWEPTI